MNKLSEMFPYEARKERKPRRVEKDLPDDPEFTESVKVGILTAVGAVVGFFLILLLIGFFDWLGEKYGM